MTSEAVQAEPLLPELIALMTVPLYLGYLIKHELFGGALFALMYSWAVISMMVVPCLVVIEAVVLARGWLGNSALRPGALRSHAAGLLVGIGAMLAVVAVR